MSSTIEGRKLWRRYAMERALAPHVDKKWAESFILELRLIGIQGVRIGAALSEVESHCSESGENAQQAFGAPVDYARSLQLPGDSDHSPAAVVRSLEPIMVQVLGMLLLNWSFSAWLRGQILDITTGHLLIASVALLAMVAVVPLADSLFRMAVYHQIRIVILMFFIYLAITATCVAAIRFLDGVIWSGSAGWGLAVGATTLAGGVAWAIARRRAVGSDEDPITSPFDNAGSSANDEARGSRSRFINPALLGSLVDTAMIPVMTVSLFAVTLVLHQMKPG
jgi:hypothetical protein